MNTYDLSQFFNNSLQKSLNSYLTNCANENTENANNAIQLSIDSILATVIASVKSNSYADQLVHTINSAEIKSEWFDKVSEGISFNANSNDQTLFIDNLVSSGKKASNVLLSNEQIMHISADIANDSNILPHSANSLVLVSLSLILSHFKKQMAEQHLSSKEDLLDLLSAQAGSTMKVSSGILSILGVSSLAGVFANLHNLGFNKDLVDINSLLGSTDVSSQAVNKETAVVAKKGKGLWLILAIIVVALVLLLQRCTANKSDTSAPDTANQASQMSVFAQAKALLATWFGADKQDKLGVSVLNNQVYLDSDVPNQDAKTGLLSAAAKIFGNDKTVDALNVNSSATPFSFSNWDALYTALKGFGTSGLTALIDFGHKNVQVEPAVLTSSASMSGLAALNKALGDDFTFNGKALNDTPLTIGTDLKQNLSTDTKEAPVFDKTPTSNVTTSTTDNSSDNASKVQHGKKLSITFEKNSANLSSADRAELDKFAQWLKAHNVKGIVVGYTDNTGNSTYNQRLSEDRARMVRRYLAKQAGLPDSYIGYLGQGQSNPIADNNTKEGREANRRIEFVTK